LELLILLFVVAGLPTGYQRLANFAEKTIFSDEIIKIYFKIIIIMIPSQPMYPI